MAKKLSDFRNFGKFLFYVHANFQMLHYALKDGGLKYERMCFVLR